MLIWIIEELIRVLDSDGDFSESTGSNHREGALLQANIILGSVPHYPFVLNCVKSGRAAAPFLWSEDRQSRSNSTDNRGDKLQRCKWGIPTTIHIPAFM